MSVQQVKKKSSNFLSSYQNQNLWTTIQTDVIRRSHLRDETWSPSLWKTFFCHVCYQTVGPQILSIEEILLSTCGSKKFALDALGDHVITCTVHSGTKKSHDWSVEQTTDLFRTRHKVKTPERLHRCLGSGVSDVVTSILLSIWLTWQGRSQCHWCWNYVLISGRWGSRSNLSLNGQLYYPLT
jgi:hypothetical protein